MKYEIEHNIPIPRPQKPRGTNVEFPWDQMEKGDSFLVVAPRPDQNLSQRLRNACSIQKRCHHKDWEFSVRWTEGGYRVWRTK